MDVIIAIWNFYSTISVIFTTWMLFNIIRAYKIMKSEDKAEPKENKSTKLVYIDTVNVDLVMMYDRATRSFIAQANSIEDLWKLVEERYPNTNFVLTDVDKTTK